MYCCFKNSKPNIGHIDVDISDIEQNTKNNDISSTNKIFSKKNNNININNQNDNQNSILQRFFVNNLNQINKNSNNFNKCKYENITVNNNQFNNSSRNIINQRKININNNKSENYIYNSVSINHNASIIIEESENKKSKQKESSNNRFNNLNYYKNNSILSKMTDNFSCRDEANDFNNIMYRLNNRNITDEDIISAPKLKITADWSGFFNGREILINAAGIINDNSNLHTSSKILTTNNNYDIQPNSLRFISYENKGIAYFGQNSINNKNFVGINYNREKFVDYNKIEIFFYIFYLRETKKYYLMPHNNSIIFVKINPKTAFPINQGEIISLDNTILMIKRNKSSFNNYLSIYYNQENFIFKDEEYFNPNKYIKIGRDKNCDIIIENRKSVSRVNAIIKYNSKSDEWEIFDGDDNNRKSLNGISFLIKGKYEINNDCEIEFLGQRFKIQIINDIKNDCY